MVPCSTPFRGSSYSLLHSARFYTLFLSLALETRTSCARAAWMMGLDARRLMASSRRMAGASHDARRIASGVRRSVMPIAAAP